MESYEGDKRVSDLITNISSFTRCLCTIRCILLPVQVQPRYYEYPSVVSGLKSCSITGSNTWGMEGMAWTGGFLLKQTEVEKGSWESDFRAASNICLSYCQDLPYECKAWNLKRKGDRWSCELLEDNTPPFLYRRGWVSGPAFCDNHPMGENFASQIYFFSNRGDVNKQIDRESEKKWRTTGYPNIPTRLQASFAMTTMTSSWTGTSAPWSRGDSEDYVYDLKYETSTFPKVSIDPSDPTRYILNVTDWSSSSSSTNFLQNLYRKFENVNSIDVFQFYNFNYPSISFISNTTTNLT